MKLAITGATGFLGGRLARLAIEAGHRVAGTGRDRVRGEALGASGVTFVPGEITDRSMLLHCFEGAEVVVHCAGLSSPWGRYADFHLANVDGTRAVVAAAKLAGVRRLVHVSTSSVYFRYRDQLGLREDGPLPRPVSAYAATKAKAEMVAATFRPEVFVVRPRAIFGAGDSVLLPRLLRAAARRPLPLLRGGRALVDMTHVDVVCDAILAMASAPAAAAGFYNITHGEPITVRDLIERLMSSLDQPFTWRPTPWPLAFGAAGLAEVVAAARPGRPEPIATRYSLGLLAFSQTLSIARAKAALGWAPRIPLDHAVEQTIRAARQARR